MPYSEDIFIDEGVLIQELQKTFPEWAKVSLVKRDFCYLIHYQIKGKPYESTSDYELSKKMVEEALFPEENISVRNVLWTGGGNVNIVISKK